MIEIVRSRVAMAVAIGAAFTWALGSAFFLLGNALLSGPSAFNTSKNLWIAGSWLQFVAVLIFLGAIAALTWSRFLRQDWPSAWELTGLSVSTLIFTIASLIIALQAPNPTNGADVVAGIGVGGWALVLIVSAARYSIAEQSSSIPRQSGLRLWAAAAVICIAVSVGLPTQSVTDPALSVTIGVFFLVGFKSLAAVLSIARKRHLISFTPLLVVLIGLGLLAAEGLADAIGGGIVFGSAPSLTGVRVATSVPSFFDAAAFSVLGWAALLRLRALVGPAGVAVAGGEPGVEGAVPTGSALPPVSASIPAAWLPDPARRHELRWWDGSRWTEHVQDSGRPATDQPYV